MPPVISGRCNMESITVSDVIAGGQLPLITTLYLYPFHVDGALKILSIEVVCPEYPAPETFTKLPVFLSTCHWYDAPVVTPASIVKLAELPSQMVESTGCEMISGRSRIVSTAGLELASGAHVPLMTARYWQLFIADVPPLI